MTIGATHGPDGTGTDDPGPHESSEAFATKEAASLDSASLDSESTGDPRVDAAVAPLTELAAGSAAGHVEVYEGVHRGLADALADLDD